MKLIRRKIIKYILSFPVIASVYSKNSSACSDPHPIYVSKNNLFGSEHENITEYLMKMHNTIVQKDTNKKIHLKMIDTENNHNVIPFIVTISNLAQHEICRKIDVYVESK